MLILQPGDVFADHYRLTRLIDTGGFADVWEAVFLSAGNTVALKIYPRLDEEGGKNIENEYRNQADLSHSHLLIARYFGRHNGYPFLEMRYCSGGNASGKLGDYDEAELAKCCYHIACALEYLHENNIVHQDIKPNNFLLDSNGNYYLADLGLSLKVRQTIKKFTVSGPGQKSSFTGLTPPAYRAFELYDRTTIGDQPVKASDIWALGASLYEMATGNMPFGEFGGLSQQRDPQPPSLPDKFSPQLNRGIVSVARRMIGGISHVQFDGVVGHGNSGGPLMDSQNRVIGMVTLALPDAEGKGNNWAISADELRRELQSLPPLTVNSSAP